MYGSFNYGISTYASDVASELLITSVKPEMSLVNLELPRDINRINLYLLQMLSELSLLRMLNESNRIRISNRFDRLFENLMPLCWQVIASMDLYLRVTGISATEYTLDVYDLGEEGYSEVKPFVEVHVNVESVDEMLSVWESAINFLKIRLGDEVLNFIDVFFTRAR